jgi:hypothetical protein
LGNVGCTLSYALGMGGAGTGANPHGGDIIVVTAGATYADPGNQSPVISGWTP